MSDKPSIRVLVVDEEIPWPANTGKRLRTLNLMTCLAGEFDIDYLVHGHGTTPEAIEEMKRRGITVIASNSRVPDKSGWRMPFRIASSVAARLPYSVHSHFQRGFAAALGERLAAGRYDMIHCEWTPYAIYLQGASLPVCIAAHNIEWEIWQRMTAAESRPLHRVLFGIQASFMERFERRVFGASRFVTAVSAGDAATIQSIKRQEVVVVANGVDGDAYRPPDAEPSGRSLVFTGSMDWRPNQDAIRWFVEAVHPLLIQGGDYRLHVVGRQPPDWLRDPSFVPPQVIVTGTVDDVRPYIAGAAVYVVPLRIGGGSRLKILEALAMGRAVVSTTVGAEGLDLEPGVNILFEDTPEGFTAAINQLWQDEPRRRALGQAGRQVIDRQYRWEQIAPLQGALWRRAAATSAK
jgi:glycosyltransferase involved in cell wall biosynthesis